MKKPTSTPLSAILSRWLPTPLVYCALSAIYTLLIIGIILTIGFIPEDMIYLDIAASGVDS